MKAFARLLYLAFPHVFPFGWVPLVLGALALAGSVYGANKSAGAQKDAAQKASDASADATASSIRQAQLAKSEAQGYVDPFYEGGIAAFTNYQARQGLLQRPRVPNEQDFWVWTPTGMNFDQRGWNQANQNYQIQRQQYAQAMNLPAPPVQPRRAQYNSDQAYNKALNNYYKDEQAWKIAAGEGTPTMGTAPVRQPGETAASFALRENQFRSDLIDYGKRYGQDVTGVQNIAPVRTRKEVMDTFRGDLKTWQEGKPKRKDYKTGAEFRAAINEYKTTKPRQGQYLQPWKEEVAGYTGQFGETVDQWNEAAKLSQQEADQKFREQQEKARYTPEKIAEEIKKDPGYYAPVSDLESYKKDVGYVPMVSDEESWRQANDPTYIGPVNTLDDLAKTPGYAFGLEQGNRGIQNSAAARGTQLSGATLKALTKYGSDYASTKWQDYYKMRAQAFNDAVSRGQNAYQGAFARGQGATSNAFGRIMDTARFQQGKDEFNVNAGMQAAAMAAGQAVNAGQIGSQSYLTGGAQQVAIQNNLGNAFERKWDTIGSAIGNAATQAGTAAGYYGT